MQRKLVQLGSTTLVVAVPPAWIKQHNLDKGDVVDIVEKDDKVVVSATRKDALRSTEVNISSGKGFLSRLVIVPYVKGYDEIVCICPDAQAMDQVSNLVHKMIGVEVIDQRHDRLVIRNIANEKEEEFRPIFRRTWFLLLSMMDDGLAAVEHNDKDAMLRVARSEQLIEKYVFYCMRLINKKGFSPADEAYLAYMILYAMENCSDKMSVLLKGAHKRKASKTEQDFLKRLSAAVRSFHDLYYERDANGLLGLRKAFDDLYRKSAKLSNNSTRDALMWITEQFYQLSHLMA